MTTRGCRVLLLCLLASGTAGCLLFTDPINTAPAVAITPGPDIQKFVRTTAAQFAAIAVAPATAIDPDQSTASLNFDWYQDKTCDRALNGAPEASGPGLVAFLLPPFQPKDLGPGCVAVVVTDKHGATATATQRYDVADLAPVAVLEVQPGAGQRPPVAGQAYPIALFSKLTLSGAQSYDLDDDTKPTPIWNVYTADDKQVLMPGCPDNSKGPYVCTFTSSTPGTYRVQLLVNDSSDMQGEAEQFIQVDVDQLPNIVLDSAEPLPPTSPNEPPLVMFADQDNAITINRVEDDGDPYPSSDPLNPTTSPAGFVWFWRNYPTDVSFQRWIGSGPTFPIARKTFSAQDTIQVRVEYHDRVTACQPRTPGCDAAFGLCEPNAMICYAPYLRAQWVTWTVTFR